VLFQLLKTREKEIALSETALWVVTPLVIANILYATLAGGYFVIQHRPGMALAFAGYVIANIGLIWDAIP
jgi:hypothetical protein